MPNQQTTVLVNNTALSPWVGNVDAAGYALGNLESITGKTGSSNALLLNPSSGVVGIGLTSPVDKLHVATVADSAATTNTLIRISTNTANAAGLRMHQVGQVEYTMAIDANATTGKLRIVNTNGNLGASASLKGIIIDKDGKVGVGKAAGSNFAVLGLPTYASNALALAGGLTAGDFYTDGAGALKVVF